MIKRYFYIVSATLFILLSSNKGIKAEAFDPRMESLERQTNSPPEGFNYQAILRDENGNVLVNNDVTVRFTLSDYEGDVWIEEHSITTNAYGVVSLVIGEGTATGGSAASFDAIDWSSSISIKVESDAGSGFADLGTNELKSVPYANYAQNGITTEQSEKLDAVNASAEENVQADWNESDNTSDSYISNKPTIPTDINELTDQDNLLEGSTFSGSFEDLTDVPETLDTDSTDDFSGSYTDLTNVPANIDIDSTDDFSGSFTDLTNVPENIDTDATDDFSGSYTDLTNVPENIDIDSTDDFSGSYNDLSNVPEDLVTTTDLVFANNSDVVSAGDANDSFVFGSTQLNDNATDSDADARMLFEKSTGAFRVGHATGTQWDSRGAYSFAAGNDNQASGTKTVISGGEDNKATDNFAVIGGGYFNEASGSYATIGGGRKNVASGLNGTIGGGYINKTVANYSTIGGGVGNEANQQYSTISGGSYNTASGSYTTIGGGRNNTSAGGYSNVDGGYQNNASGSSATVGGGGYNVASAGYSTIGGGYSNNINSSEYSTIGGGYNNGINTIGYYVTIGGGRYNQATNSSATIAGGSSNMASGQNSAISGGQHLNAESLSEFVAGQFNAGADSPSPDSFVASDRIFTIGNGTSNAARSNAMVVLKNGDTDIDGNLVVKSLTIDAGFTLPMTDGINSYIMQTDGSGTVSWVDPSSLSSDKRLKKDFRDLENVLTALQKIDGYKFKWNDVQANRDQESDQIGFIAQEIHKVYPELVITDKEGFLRVKYVYFVPVLLEAIKELSAQNQRLISHRSEDQKRFETLENQVALLMKMMAPKQSDQSNTQLGSLH